MQEEIQHTPTEKKIVCAVALLPIISEMFEELTFEAPKLFKQELKNSIIRLVKETESQQRRIFEIQNEAEKREISEELFEIQKAFRLWIKDNFQL